MVDVFIHKSIIYCIFSLSSIAFYLFTGYNLTTTLKEWLFHEITAVTASVHEKPQYYEQHKLWLSEQHIPQQRHICISRFL